MIGTRLGQYRIDALLGQGGMGAVYLATDEMLGRQVAIKVLREDADVQGTATERFRSEAQILSRLDHPQILRLYGFSQHEGVLYMVTEFVRGEALQRRLERGIIVDTPQVVEWASQVLDALHYAHQLGVVHRDIKPANILIDDRNRARLLDFGIARIVGTEGPTQTGHAVGTLTYMAPEQVLDETIDGRADLYAFAVVLCQMFAGRRPYRSTTTAGLIREIVDGPSPDVAALLPPETAVFAPALLRALARHPADRTPTAGRMRDELVAAAKGPLLPPPILPPLNEKAIPTASAPMLDATRAATGGFAIDSGANRVATGLSGGATDSTLAVPPPMSRVRRVGGLALVVPAVLLLTAAAVGWYVFGPSRPDAPPVAVAPSESTPPSTVPPTVPPSPGTTDPDAVNQPPPPSAGLAGASPTTAPETPSTAAPAARGARSAATARAAAAPPPATGGSVALPAPDTTTPAALPEPVEAPRAPVSVPSTPGATPATAVFKGMILMDRIDDEDEELDVSVRLDARRVVVLDEDGIAKRSIGYDSIARATYNSRKPGRFSLRRGPSHWLTLEVGTTPIVLRLNGRTYEQVLTALQGHGVRVERQP